MAFFFLSLYCTFITQLQERITDNMQGEYLQESPGVTTEYSKWSVNLYMLRAYL